MSLGIGLTLGALIGVLLGLLGGGGSILAVPALVYGLGLGVEEAIPVSLIVVAAASAVGVLPKIRAGQVRWRMAAIFATAGVPATVVGSTVSRHLPESAVLIGFAVVMVVAGLRMLTDQANTGTACEVRSGQVNWRRCAPRSIGAGLVVGVLTGLFGVGGGFLIIPALVVVLGVEMSTAIGTSLVIIVANSAAGIFSHLQGVSVDWSLTAAFVATAMAASLVAGYFGARVDTDRLQRWFAYLVFVVAAYVLVDTVVLR
ncbi:sulfite exporter TauE/SafE family protein [Mycolicibacterium flavescens]|uniref:Probable membrane transporter protein n=1 Tax=Mycolicibacterium flavescens TaxID=1776 RepID=A0A1E3RIB0_MYCFV|nr:sulfite exporter TauE/SafE family protein [Mycolicibacterium flavescens]MCV7282157.1 sulfite exporter TauE/SafE family protein [Mycolicibacterium flavescens]ODQ89579.1 permease [Mycolicibacterium flavescens]